MTTPLKVDVIADRAVVDQWFYEELVRRLRMAVMYAWKKLLLFMVVETSESWKLTLDELVENGNGK